MPVTKRPFRLTAPLPLEQDIHEQTARVLDRVLLPPAVWACYPAGHIKLAPAEVARLGRAGLKRGWPDILIIFQGLVFGIELKRRGQKLSKTRVGRTRRGAPRIYEGQEDVFPRLHAAGMTIAVCNSVDAVLHQLRRWGIPTR
jgi:hypothetical protein